MTFPEKLRRYRTERGLSQKEMGELLGISGNYVYQIESGIKDADPNSSLGKLFSRMERDAEARGPRAELKRAREQAGMSQLDLAKAIGYEVGVLQSIEDNGARISEAMAEKIVKALPRLELETLLGGGDHPAVEREDGLIGTYGAKPAIDLPHGVKARMIPLLSWAQAGALGAGWGDECYSHEAVLAVDIKDRKAFGLEIRGDSMTPKIDEGDIALVCPSWTPRSGDVVIARTLEGDVMCKVFQPRSGGIILSSYNPAHPPIELTREEIAWIYPVGGLQKSFRREQ